MSVWLICTFFIINIVKDFIIKEKISIKNLYIRNFNFIFNFYKNNWYFDLCRIFNFTIFLFYNTNNNTKYFLKKIYKSAIIFFIITLTGIYILNPHFWDKPGQYFLH